MIFPCNQCLNGYGNCERRMIRGCGVKLGGRRVKFGIGSLKAGLVRFRLPDGFLLLALFFFRFAHYKIACFP